MKISEKCENIEFYSNLSLLEWKEVRGRFISPPPYDLHLREKAMNEAFLVFNNLGLSYWLVGGALLGAIRDDAFISWDDDIDTHILEEEFILNMYSIKKAMMASGFIVRLRDQDFPKATFFKYGQKIAMNALKEDKGMLIRPAYQYPKKFYNREVCIAFKGSEVYIPSPVEQYLEFVYGKDWSSPIQSDNEYEYESSGLHRGKNPWVFFILKWLYRLGRKIGIPYKK